MSVFYSPDEWTALGPIRRQNLFAELKSREQEVVARIHQFLEDFNRQEENEFRHLVRYHQFRSFRIAEALEWPRLNAKWIKLQDIDRIEPDDSLPIMFMMRSSEVSLDEVKLTHLENLLLQHTCLLNDCTAQLPASAVQFEMEDYANMPLLHHGQMMDIMKLMDPVLLSYVCREVNQEVWPQQLQPQFCEHIFIECNDTGIMTCTSYNHNIRKTMEMKRQLIRDIIYMDDEEAIQRVILDFTTRTEEEDPIKSDLRIDCPFLNFISNQKIVNKHTTTFDVASESSWSSLSSMLAKLHLYSINLDIPSAHMETLLKHMPTLWKHQIERVQATCDTSKFAKLCTQMKSLDIKFNSFGELNATLIHSYIKKTQYMEEFRLLQQEQRKDSESASTTLQRFRIIYTPGWSDLLMLLADKSECSPNGLLALNFPPAVDPRAISVFITTAKLNPRAIIEPLNINGTQDEMDALGRKRGGKKITWKPVKPTEETRGINRVYEGEHISKSGVLIKMRFHIYKS